KLLQMTNYGKISADDLGKLEEAYEKLKKNPQNNTLMAKNLTPELFEMLKTRTTPNFGANLLDIIAAGINDPTEITGVLAADADCYEVFEPFLKNVIKDRHLIDRSSDLF
ncbi:MAG: hypothetical protein MHPSP_003735, partial [Paramarteilia canceri]